MDVQAFGPDWIARLDYRRARVPRVRFPNASLLCGLHTTNVATSFFSSPALGDSALSEVYGDGHYLHSWWSTAFVAETVDFRRLNSFFAMGHAWWSDEPPFRHELAWRTLGPVLCVAVSLRVFSVHCV